MNKKLMTRSEAKAVGYKIMGEFGDGGVTDMLYLAYLPDHEDEAKRQWDMLDDDPAAFTRDSHAAGRPWVLVAVR